MEGLDLQEVMSLLDANDDLTEFKRAINSDFKSITPTPGFCVKVKTDDNEKLFINVCHSNDIPPPPESLDMNAILSTGGGNEECMFKFPLSLGEFHKELDKSGKECKCYDVVLNSKYYQDVSKSETLRDFIMTLACSGLERKYKINIDVGTCTILKKLYHGKIPPHYIKLKSSDDDSDSLFEKFAPTRDDNESGSMLEKGAPIKDDDIVLPVMNPARIIVNADPEIRHFKLFKCPASGQAELFIFQGLMKGTTDIRSIRVFVTEKNLVVRNLKGKVIASVVLPLPVIPEQSMSNLYQNRLIVAMPVA